MNDTIELDRFVVAWSVCKNIMFTGSATRSVFIIYEALLKIWRSMSLVKYQIFAS